jgi:hypothetical protein
MLNGKLGGKGIKIKMIDTVSAVNSLIDELLTQNSHQLLIDFEDHMDTASASGKNENVSDFRNKFINDFIAIKIKK